MDILPSLKTGTFAVLLAPASDSISAMIAKLALRGPVTVLDGGNHFAAYRVAQLIRAQSMQVNQIAKRIQVRRAFTCYQVVHLLESAPPLPQPVVMLDLLTTFYDDQVKPNEASRLLTLCLTQIERLCLYAPVVMQLSPTSPLDKAFLLDRLCKQATEVFTLAAPETVHQQQLSLF